MSPQKPNKKKKIQNLSICTTQQREAVTCQMNPTLVVAGAGSGKTLVLAKRFEYLINEKNINPEEILLIAFSRKAAMNMKKRIFNSNLIDVDHEIKDKCKILTFHKFAMDFLEEEFGIKVSMKNIAYEKRDKWILRDVVEETGIKNIRATNLAWQILKKIRWIIKKEQRNFKLEDLINVGTKVTGQDPKDLLKRFPFEDMKTIYNAYNIKIKENKLYSFDDMILDTHITLANKEEIRNKWNKKFKAILCDEFQDIDDVQFEILKSLCSDNKHIFCVGDPDQSIYGFRNAVPNIFHKFQEFFESKGNGVEIKKLEQNFRSTPEVLEVANTLINTNRLDNRFSKILFTKKFNGPRVQLHICDSPAMEEDKIIQEIIDLNEKQGVPLKEIAILARNHKHQESMMMKLMERRIPYDNRRDINSSLRRVEIKDLISWLDIALSSDLRVIGSAMKRVINKPPKGIGPNKIQDLFKNGPKIAVNAIKFSEDPKIRSFYKECVHLREIAKRMDIGVNEKIIQIIQRSSLLEHYRHEENRLQRIKSFLKSILNEEKTLEGIKERILQWTPKSLDGDEITISTIHGVKGLEFKYVFLMKLGEGLIPSKIGMNRANSQSELDEYIEEEKRLTYVAITRAKYGLYLSCSSGSEKLSRFAKIIEPLLVVREEFVSDDSIKEDKDIFEDISYSDEELTYDTDSYLLSEEVFEVEGEEEI